MDFKISGSGQIGAGDYDDVKISGSGKACGFIRCHDFQVLRKAMTAYAAPGNSGFPAAARWKRILRRSP